ncbi:DUF4369 domain-containing protein [Antarcticibacterium sp. 1MA-6-2]|uniref:DUF4369 domain-containing protein n=1 Tax=Antarcticibacterium sp. 1MA-6-2 TaxID=2908210 RepID=UPI001F39CCA9|nr:DUF4369 domain-containing protein [Antarcticibacterium sp. 1MA-6-2]UJH92412.1 DUF4369 domain-containing protein [Antarcticibacterium sp. 1MA-6-2]
MKKLGFFTLVFFTLIACSTKENNFKVSGSVKGLKKGTLYLQKIEDTMLVNVDSVVIKGDANFVLEDYLESPQIMYLYLDKVDNVQYDDRIEFFAEEGEVTINTTLKNFEIDAKVNGSANQEKLAEYRQMMRRFNDKNLELIQQNFEAQRDENDSLLLKTNEAYDQLLKRKYLYTVNFAINNKNLELAPYLALSEVFDANIKYLDTIYISMTPQVQKSMYGKELKDFLQERRRLEKLEAKVTEE